jgi:hypothetical protein
MEIVGGDDFLASLPKCSELAVLTTRGINSLKTSLESLRIHILGPHAKLEKKIMRNEGGDGFLVFLREAC